jgi:hypothetical protein
MQATHPIYHAFFEIDRLDIVPQQAYNAGEPIFRGVYEDNDPGTRLQIIINYNTESTTTPTFRSSGNGRARDFVLSIRPTRRTSWASTTSRTV